MDIETIIAAARAFRAELVAAGKDLADDVAPKHILMYDEWKPDTDYITGDRRRDNGILYKARQNHTSQEQYRPASIPALWEVLAEPSQTGTRDNPIIYNDHMAIENGKFYDEGGVIYECFRDSGNPLYCALSAVVDVYVHVAT